MTSPHQPQSVQAPHLRPHLLLRICQPVHVNHRASWLDATVTSVGSRTVGVTYPNAAAAVPFADAVLPWAVRPADGAQLRPARQVTVGDQIIFGNHIRTAAAPPVDGRDGWLVLHFTDGAQPAMVMPGAVLRLIDDTPQVTVNGQPLSRGVHRHATPGRA
jgi:hypothetical protein